MQVFGVNKILKWCQAFSNGKSYTCPTKAIDGKLFFRFKNEGQVLSNSFQSMLTNQSKKAAMYFLGHLKNKTNSMRILC